MENRETSAKIAATKKKQKKRLQYNRMPDEKKRELIFRVMYLNENIRSLCYELGLNFSSGRNLVQRYKKTGEYDSQNSKLALQQAATITGQSSKKDNVCPLGIVCLDGTRLKIVAEKTFTSDDEEKIIQLHNFYVRNTVFLK